MSAGRKPGPPRLKAVANDAASATQAEWPFETAPANASAQTRGLPAVARTKAVPVCLRETLLEQLLADLEQHGVTMLAKLRAEKPVDYIKIIASLLPKDAPGREGPSDPITEVRYTIVDP